jgi:ComF family protein
MKWISDLLDDFSGLFFPRICFGCGNNLLRNERIICTECHFVIPKTNFHCQPENPVEKLFWGRCRIEKAAAYSFYNRGSRIRRLIHNLKYKGIKEIGYELGIIYGHSLRSSGFTDNISFIMPVPLHPSKEKARGFNQSMVICEGMSEATGIPVLKDVLVRSSVSATQTKRSRYERWENVEGIFAVTNSSLIHGKHILLIDDVITTGSTIEACVNELSKTEGVKVSVAALAVAVM